MKVLLYIFSLFIGLSATVAGILLIAYPDGSILNLPINFLQQTPFKNYLIPGLLLAITVGGTNLFVVFLEIKEAKGRYNWALAGGILTCIWAVIQIIVFSGANWLQFIHLIIGLLICLIAYQIKGKWAV